MLTVDSLIRKGYFPEELSPIFSTETLADTLNTIIQNISNYPDKPASATKHSIPRVKHLRRMLSIPNPLLQIKLCNAIEDNWNTIDGFLSNTNMTLTKPVILQDSKRAVSRLRHYSYIPVQQALDSTSVRYVLRTDISRFYPTIYTHSIPWALHTKEVAKINRKDALYGNLLDKRVRNSMDGQTLGIPVGPDTSLIIAEIIATSMDVKLRSRLGDTKGFRYMDDYYLYFSSKPEAEFALSTLHSIMKDFELELNPNKTFIEELPVSLEQKWVSELRNYNIRETVKGQHTDLIGYFSLAFDYSKTYTNDRVLKYALSRIKNIEIKNENWSLYESLILNSVIAEPSVIPIAALIFYKRKDEGHIINTSLISDTITEIIMNSVKFNYDNEVAWCLWMSKLLNIEVKESAAIEISKSDDNVVALAALDLLNSNLIPRGLDNRKWKSIMKSSELYTDNWLLAYEAYVKGWLPSASGRDYVSSDGFFGTLKANNVEFYRGVTPLIPAPLIAEETRDAEDTTDNVGNDTLDQDETIDY
ncbi:RNA-directed DNA polymerase [Paenibacillus sp. FSL H7-0756]|uniref:RNA-directed DNA polymerase n=1 Tax=Paenibacillus sp. FSL H7-0756 TaxID=2954738 RepID=UPI0030F57317